MALYAVGDVQGCYGALCRLLDRLDFEESRDRLWLAGDLVNRGPESAKVIRLVKSLPDAQVVLGNHDLHLLAVSEGFRQVKATDTFDDVLTAPDRDELLFWLRQQPLICVDTERDCVLVHAGLHPRWTVRQAVCQAHEVESLLRDDGSARLLLERMYGDSPVGLSDGLDVFERARWVINAFTRMRFLGPGGEMDFEQVGPPGSQPEGLRPWFDMRRDRGVRVVFGHWSLLGAGEFGNAIALDSGCVYGGRLSAVNLDERPARFVRVACGRPR